ncbi:hypothetical protein BFJ72_g1735 [Fusarium proliferatum]|uniref:Allergen n=1 Tax=Gibberella intermedia TaxID=948311 RepID=A0A420U175_GIBIN|nr:hypothetical protein BFJ72_g1735 [Fusarium proliferatum]
MEKAKQAVSSFLSNDGKHRTTVDEDVKPHVTQEHVMPHQHEQVTTALDKEVHQEHHHTTVQPITHKETLPEQHHHNLIPVEHKTFHHGNEQDTRATLDREAAKYRDTTETHSTTHSTEAAPVVTGERTKTLEEFTQERGGLKERAAQKLTEFEGCPKPYRRELQGEQLEGDKSMHLHGHGDNYGENQAFAGREGHGMGRNTEGLAAGAAAGAGAAAATRKHRHGIGHKERRGSASSSSSLSSSDEESRGLGKSSKTKNRGLGSSTGTGVGAGAAAAAASAAHSHHQNREGAAAAPSTLEGNRGIGSNTGLQAGSGIPGTAGAGSGVESMGTTGNMSNFGSSNRGIGNTNTAGLNKPHTGEYDQVKTGGLHNDPLNSQHSRGDSGVGMQTGKKPSLLDRLNPMKDADGDGKKGLLD